MEKFIIKKQSPKLMIIEVDCHKLSAAEQIFFFGKEFSKITSNEELVFIQKFDHEFSIEIMIHYGFDIYCRTIKKGEYPIKIEGSVIQVFIDLSYTNISVPQ